MKDSHKNGFIATGVIFYTLFTFAAMAWAGTYSGGSGTAEDPYKISTVADWQELIATSTDDDKHFILLNDIDFGGINLTPVAPDTDPATGGFQGTAFTGIVDGNGHILHHAVINLPDRDYVGLFGFLGNGGQIRNLGVNNVNITGYRYVGGLVGRNDNGTISTCYANSPVNGFGESVGGIVGYSSGGTITACYASGAVHGYSSVGGLVGVSCSYLADCYATGTVSGFSSVGGLVGENCSYFTDCYATGTVSGTGNSIGGLSGWNRGTITNSYSSGSVSGPSRVGGLVGYNSSLDMITVCYASGAVSGSSSVGGLVGYNNNSTVTACYATGMVSGFSSVGGLVGYHYKGTITACYATGAVSGSQDYIGGLVGQNSGTITACLWDMQTTGQAVSGGGRGLTTEQMNNPSIYQHAGWGDLGWVIPEGANYPRLSWENTGGTPIPPAVIPFAGSGTAADPYRISTAEDFAILNWNSDILNKYIQLTADLDLSGISLYPIGDLHGRFFTGVFDGGGHTLIHGVIHQPGNDYVGLFSRVGSGGQIRNLGVEDMNIIGRNRVGGLVGGGNINGTISACYVTGAVSGCSYVGGLVGENDRGKITACYAMGTVSGTGDSVGGLVGQNLIDSSMTGTITTCYATGIVNGNYTVGGLVGRNYGTIRNCYATGTVSSTGNYIGGLAGMNGELYGEFGNISACYATGTVSGYDNVGGLVGSNDGYLITCYSTGKVTGTGHNTGGLIGLYSGTSVSSCFWNIETSGQTISAAGIGKTTAEIIDINTCLEAGWSFIKKPGDSAEWQTVPQWYPALAWETVDLIPFPNVIGQTQGNAETALLTAGFRVVLQPAYSDTVPAGLVIQTFPSIEGLAPKNACVYLAISIGKGYSGGIGTEENPCRISTPEDLIVLGQTPSDYIKHFVLTADIDLGAYTFTTAVIAPDTDATASDYQGPLFSGSFDGNNHRIVNLTINTKDDNDPNNDENDYLGLFGWIGKVCKVRNLVIENAILSGTSNSEYLGGLSGQNEGEIDHCSGVVDVRGGDWVGGLVGRNSSGTITDCNATSTVSGAGDFVGGLAGVNAGTITTSHTSGAVSGFRLVGGLAGANSSLGTITDCFATGTVSGSSSVGGLVGGLYGTITDCFTTGTISGSGDFVGGLVGEIYEGTITGSYATGAVNGFDWTGGLVGINNAGTVTTCLATGAVSGRSYVGGLVGMNCGKVTICYATGAVNSSRDSAGGLVGWNDHGTITVSYAAGTVTGSDVVGGLAGANGGTITDCYATGAVGGMTSVGGLVGGNGINGNSGTIITSHATGAVSGSIFVGGLCGQLKYGYIDKCFWDVQTSGQTASAGGTGKSTDEMKDPATFTSAGWDFTKIWWSPNEGYPQLLWGRGYSGGSGTAEDPYKISSVTDWQELVSIVMDWDKYFVLVNDIDFAGKEILPVAPDTGVITSVYDGTPFIGCIDGRGHVLQNVVINQPNNYYVGLFGYLGPNSRISNLGILNATIHGRGYVGGLAGTNDGGSIMSCCTTGIVDGTWRFTGGLIGNVYGGSIIDSYSNCSIMGTSAYVGGLVGMNDSGSITTSYTAGTVTGSMEVGGLCGGKIMWGNYEDTGNFWDTQTSQKTYSMMGVGKTTAQMKALATFTAAGWDFVGESANGTSDVWRMCGDGIDYPRLSWEFSQGGDKNCPDGVGLEDLAYQAGRWMADTPETVGAADANGDGKVDYEDFGVLSEHFGTL